jgi:hypothetical protein
MADPIPHNDDQFADWTDTLKTAATEIGTRLGFTTEVLASITTQCGNFRTALNNHHTAHNEAEAVTREKENQRQLVETFFRALAQTTKHNPACTDADLERLGIKAPEPPPGEGESAPAQPKLTAKAQPRFEVHVGFRKGDADDEAIYSRRGNEPDFSLLATDTHSPYVDNRPPLVAGQPEVRDYKGRHRRKGVEYGPFSDTVSITAGP